MPELYEFQKQAVEFLLEKKSVLLADDMGLGKTAQAIVLDRERRLAQPGLVKEPKTLVVTYLGIFKSWQDHYGDWSPHARVHVINNKNRTPFLEALARDDIDVFVCHWQVLRLIKDELAKIKWFHIIADECHAIQDRKSKQTLALKALKTWYKTGLSGTPAFDKPDDLWSILNWLYPDYWRSFWRYYNDHIEWVDYNGYRTIVGVRQAKKLQDEISGFYIRRKKEDVLLDLPDKYNSRIVVDLHDKQARAYEAMRKDMLAWVGEHEDEPVAAPIVIAQLCRLQQFSAAYGELVTVKRKRKIEPNSERYQRRLAKGLDPNYETFEEQHMVLTDPSTKLDAVMQIVTSTPEQVVVFSQFAQVIKLLGKRLEKAKIPHGLFIGDTSPQDRAEIITNFQAGHLKVFAGTIAAGGVGITLTAASTIIFIDRAWSEALNRQAEDRLHRIGQKNAVHVIDIVSNGTIDLKRREDIVLKWSWIKKLLGEGEDDDY